jgi:hypothetical protein
MEQQGIFERPMVKWGLYLGGVLVASLFAVYILSTPSLISWWYSTLTLAVFPIIFMVLANQETRRIKNNTLLFGDGVVVCLIVGVISTLINISASYLLYNFIEPELPVILKEQLIEKTITFLENRGVSENDIEQTLTNMERQDFSQNLRTSFTSILVMSIVSAFYGLIIAAIMKRDAPLFEEEA